MAPVVRCVLYRSHVSYKIVEFSIDYPSKTLASVAYLLQCLLQYLHREVTKVPILLKAS